MVDPLGQRPAVWFQRMDAPRPQRNRIHVDVSVPHDEAEPRIQAALAAGGTAEPIYDRTGGGQPPWVRFLSQNRRPTAKTTAVGLQMSTLSPC